MLDINDIEQGLEDIHLEDQSVVQTGGGNFEKKLLPMGSHSIRLVGYVEMGIQPGGEYDGKQKPDEDQVRLTVELLSKRVIEEREDGKGQFAPRRSVTRKLSLHQKAGYMKLFQLMRGGDTTITHMTQMIAKKAWKVEVVWRTKDEAGNYITVPKAEAKKYEDRLKNAKTDAEKKNFRIFDNIDWTSITAAVVAETDEDGEETGEVKPLNVPAVIGGLQCFIWDNPKPAFWQSLFIEGTYTKKVDDKEVEVSKNYLQEAILAAKNYEGSPLQAMLDGLDDLPGLSEPEKEPETPEEPEDEPKDKPETPSEDDEFQELGLDNV